MYLNLTFPNMRSRYCVICFYLFLNNLLLTIFMSLNILSHSMCDNFIVFYYEVKWNEFTQSCPTLCNPVDCSLPGSSICGIFQARILKWVAISFSRGSSQPRDWTQASCIAGRLLTLRATRDISKCIFICFKLFRLFTTFW